MFSQKRFPRNRPVHYFIWDRLIKAVSVTKLSARFPKNIERLESHQKIINSVKQSQQYLQEVCIGHRVFVFSSEAIKMFLCEIAQLENISELFSGTSANQRTILVSFWWEAKCINGNCLLAKELWRPNVPSVSAKIRIVLLCTNSSRHYERGLHFQRLYCLLFWATLLIGSKFIAMHALYHCIFFSVLRRM